MRDNMVYANGYYGRASIEGASSWESLPDQESTSAIDAFVVGQCESLLILNHLQA